MLPLEELREGRQLMVRRVQSILQFLYYAKRN
jgi:hypothetical protein